MNSILVFVIALALAHGVAALECEASGYCSLGHSKPWTGDIRLGHKLREMLASVSFKKELIVVAVTYAEGNVADKWRLDDFGDLSLQIHQNAMNLGFAHMVFVSGDDNRTCLNLQAESLNPISCVWDSGEATNAPEWLLHSIPNSGRASRSWHQRARLLARSIRLGYNVLMCDSDTIFFKDPYVHFKSPPLSNIQFMCNQEGRAMFYCNMGFVYVQDAAPDGPVSWIFMDVIRTALRRADDHYNFSSQWTGQADNCLTFDQSMVEDSTMTSAVGRPVYQNAIESCKPSKNPEDPRYIKARNGQQISLKQVLNNIDSLSARLSRGRFFTASANKSWLDEVGWIELPEQDTKLWMANLTVPNMNYGFPAELGGSIWPEASSGIYSDTWRKTLLDDCPDCPWWDESRAVGDHDPLTKFFPPNDYSKLPKLNKSQLGMFIDHQKNQETMGNLPRFFVSSLMWVRRGMTLGPAARNKHSQLTQAIGHIHVWSAGEPRKLIFRKLTAQYNYSLGKFLTGKRNETPYEHRKPFNKVLVLDPKIDLSRTRNWKELATIITGMIQVAKISKRVLVMPDLPCETQWIHDPWHLKKYSKVCSAPFFTQDDGSIFWPFIYPRDESTGELVGGWSSRRLLGDAPKETNYLADQKWWSNQRYRAVLPSLIDPPCLKRARAIVPPDLFHWLKYTKAGRRGERWPSAKSSAFQVAKDEMSLQLTPPVDFNSPNTSGIGGTVDPLSNNGWSWYDRQAAVSVVDVLSEMLRLRDQSVVYLAHPVMVVPREEGGSAADPVIARRRHRVEQINNASAQSFKWPQWCCRALRELFNRPWEAPLVNFSHGIKSRTTDKGLRILRA